MVYSRLSLVVFMLISTAAFSQDADPKLMQQAIAALQAQRNRAMDEAASAEARLLKAQQEIEDLKKQLDKK